MQSSTMTAFRAVVMLAVLVAIPLAAVFGTSTPLPEAWEKLCRGEWPLSTTGRPAMGVDAPRFVPTGPGTPLQGGMPTGTPSAAHAMVGPAVLPWPVAPAVAPAPYDLQPPLLPGNGSSLPSDRPPASLLGTPVAGEGGVPPTVPEGFDVVPAVYESAAPGSGARGATAALQEVDRFTQIQDRLRELGATYYLLESWGNRHELYRFYCRMAVAGNPNCTRYFEATDSKPLGSMAAVLRQVEDWRGGCR